jgi:hypothetical protein
MGRALGRVGRPLGNIEAKRQGRRSFVGIESPDSFKGDGNDLLVISGDKPDGIIPLTFVFGEIAREELCRWG